MSTSGISAVAAGGLALDIAGALLIALGLMFKKPKKAIEEATPKWGFNTDLETSLACQTADAQAGAFLLVLGFAVQFAAALGWHETSWPDAVAAVASAIVFDSAVAAALFKQWRPWQLRRMLFARLQTLDYAAWWPALAAYGPRLGQPPPEKIAVDVTFAEYGRHLLGSRLWGRLIADRQLPDVLTKLRRELAGTPEYEAAHSRPPTDP